ncbi:MAG: flavodoxin-dependent (E)-4-hydroxy-3-methylbut-2-enyl-diphosphate synthase [Candidatus Acetothermia bacterium]|jgi:(E)-4-hydroxy-3-methylbut-2-enyl-diphosphate synthase|nr:flavodoxin-dependent (E)-4-hydroxy-3-methylbut-2-enyl-diphosphate synthase [Candidatus Acetothermia bacterium]MDH7505186.1 flavodoxin-dependent (E)-4-hydroxy-3-methylbut-2-enyl-diphosphate synthase [Candidatus Acetothermia bacterium]
MIERRRTRVVKVGSLALGGANPIRVQSMTNTDTRNVAATVAQIRQLEETGCELVRVAVPDMEAAAKLGEIKRQIAIPLVADIHYNHKLALRALEEGVDKLRLNPGNIAKREHLEEIVRAARDRGVPIRVGVNSGSLPQEILAKYEGPTPEGLVEAALREIEILEANGFFEIVVSLKASEVLLMIEAYRLFAKERDYPLHLGVTEAGGGDAGIVKSALGIGTLLQEGLGDTIRVSLTGDPVREVEVAYEILKALGLRRRGVEIVSCPTCGRTLIDLERLAAEVRARLRGLTLPIKVALMGCPVNGLGEAGRADVGLVGSRGGGTLYLRGKMVKRVPEAEIVDELVALVLHYDEARS